MTKILAHIVSVIFHPLFVVLYLLLFLLWTHPFVFSNGDKNVKIVFYIYTVVSLVIIPIISILLMKNLNIIKSVYMSDKMDRIGH
ncbi:MAG: hypothetical protein R2771_12950 [Saprospiraceae bacterium]